MNHSEELQQALINLSMLENKVTKIKESLAGSIDVKTLKEKEVEIDECTAQLKEIGRQISNINQSFSDELKKLYEERDTALDA